MIGVLTYDVPHRKTYDVLTLLAVKGYKEVRVFGIPLHYKKTFHPLIEHRPEVLHHITAQEICKNLGFEYTSGSIDLPEQSIILVCGAAILDEELITKYKVVNAHPGYIPNCRGLDSFKWAIYEGHPVGVTSHLIGDEVDAGEIIERREIKIQYNDTFHSVARRVYDLEVTMLVGAIEKVHDEHEYISGGGYEVHRRMPHSYETRLLERFELIRKNVPIEINK